MFPENGNRCNRNPSWTFVQLPCQKWELTCSGLPTKEYSEHPAPSQKLTDSESADQKKSRAILHLTESDMQYKMVDSIIASLPLPSSDICLHQSPGEDCEFARLHFLSRI